MITREVKFCNLDEAFFPVEEQPISRGKFWDRGTRVPGYKAIVDIETGRTLSIVSRKYRMINNREAYEIADYVVRAIFDGKTLQDFQCYNILMPQTRGSCRIDLIIPNNFNLLFGSDKESWTPFVRISNSYNRTMVLKYEIGFCRWICMNGMIFGQTGVTFSLTHLGRMTRTEIDKLIERSRKQIGDIGSLWNAFERKMQILHDTMLPSSSALAIYCKAFDIKVNKEELTVTQEEGLAMRAKQIVTASKEYFKELGNNAYAMMNVLTDFASFPEWINSRANYVDGYQRKVGRWVDEFIIEIQKPNFNLSRYIGVEYQNTAYYLESLVPEE